jgi:hypothetical protein
LPILRIECKNRRRSKSGQKGYEHQFFHG